jgi:ribonuclease BN (tRNA processing enzyme)
MEGEIMKFIIVGYWGGYPDAGGATSGYLLQHNGFNLLIDCGSAVVSNVQKYINIEDLNSVIISHYHHDHVADIGPLQYACLIKSKLGKFLGTLDIYGHPYDNEGFKRLTLEPYTKGIPYSGYEEIRIGPFTINFIKTKHPVICFGMRIKCDGKEIVYTADGSFLEELFDFSKYADLLICECNFYSGQDGIEPGHMNSTDAAIISEKAAVKKLLLTHLPNYGDHNKLLLDAQNHFSGKVELAKPGWVWE